MLDSFKGNYSYLVRLESPPVFMTDSGFISSSVSSVVAKAAVLAIMSLSFLDVGVILSAVRAGTEFLCPCLGSQVGGLIFKNAQLIPTTL